MKSDIHPKNYRQVIFQDSGTGVQFLIGSTVQTDQTAKWKDGKEYPLYIVEISSSSHPAYTGEQRIMDRAGRVEKFKARAAKAKK
jgi:large subunit ribosomal protein L31